jgi:diaminopimelate epimerase
MGMIVKKLLIAGGNETALVYGCPVAERKNVAKKLLKEVEQVGFVSTKTAIPKLIMMGGELCVNATLAFAHILGKRGTLVTSGLKKPISYSTTRDMTTIRLPVHFKKDGKKILLDGIGFVLYDIREKTDIRKSELSRLSKRYHLPAFGGIVYDKNEITPFVYVADVDSFARETACGSGSVAFALFSGMDDILQPTKKIIRVKQREGFFDISAEVTEKE